MSTNRTPAKRTPAKTAVRRAEPPIEDTLKDALNLDVLEREGAKGPFEFVLEGRRFLLSDPQELAWQDLIPAMSNPFLFLKLVLPADDLDDFLKVKFPTWKLNLLMQRYVEHYGLGNPLELGASLR